MSALQVAIYSQLISLLIYVAVFGGMALFAKSWGSKHLDGLKAWWRRILPASLKPLVVCGRFSFVNGVDYGYGKNECLGVFELRGTHWKFTAVQPQPGAFRAVRYLPAASVIVHEIQHGSNAGEALHDLDRVLFDMVKRGAFPPP